MFYRTASAPGTINNRTGSAECPPGRMFYRTGSALGRPGRSFCGTGSATPFGFYKIKKEEGGGEGMSGVLRGDRMQGMSGELRGDHCSCTRTL